MSVLDVFLEMSVKKFLFFQSILVNPWGGSEVLWHQAAGILNARGYAVSATLAYSANTHFPRFAELGNEGVVLDHWLEDNRLLRVFNQRCLQGNRRFKRQLKAQQWNLVVFNLNPFHRCSAQVAICRELGVPYVLIVQLVNDHIWPGETERQVLKENYTRAERVYFVSTGNRTLVENYLGVKLSNAEIIANPCRVPDHSTQPDFSYGKPVHFVCVGRIDFLHKCQDKLLQVFSADKWKERAWTLDFFGKGPNEGALLDMIEFNGLSDRVAFRGHVDDVNEIWSQAHALVLPSRSEGFPLVLNEAAAGGRLVITTDICDNAKVFPHGVASFIANGCDVRSLDQALEEAWSRRGDWKVIAEEGKRRAIEHLPDDPASDLAHRISQLVEHS